jgi:hypothetical protein
VTMDMMSADQIIDMREHVAALLKIDDESAIDADERKCLLGMDQRCESAIKQRAFGDTTRQAHGDAYQRLAARGAS